MPLLRSAITVYETVFQRGETIKVRPIFGSRYLSSEGSGVELQIGLSQHDSKEGLPEITSCGLLTLHTGVFPPQSGKFLSSRIPSIVLPTSRIAPDVLTITSGGFQEK